MSETEGAALRIYCICGQKMKVSETMFGRPGKCVACRQKIRIPKPSDLPEGTEEVHLRDHPEFLRRTLPPAEPQEGEDEAAVVLEAEGGEPLDATPIDVLERLRILCSLAHKLEKALADAGESREDRETLLGYQNLVRSLRRDLEEQIRKDLIETGGALTKAKEDIADTHLSFRIGDLDCNTFVQQVARFRRERERLERRRHNLRGWLMVDDPYAAGGYVDVKFVDIPCEGGPVKYPPEIRTEKPLAEYYAGALKEALRRQEHTSRKIDEWARMAKEGAMSSADLEEATSGSGAEWRRAKSAVNFYRERLSQVVQDCEQDILAAKARRDAVRQQRDAEKVDPETHRQADYDFVRMESDCIRVKELAMGAAKAKTAEEVPGSRGTFLRRMARPGPPGGVGVDSIVAWVASILMVVNIVVPISSAQIAGNMVVMQGLVLGLFLTATALALAAAIPSRGLRGLLINLVFVGGTLGGAHYINTTWYGLDAVGESMRANPHWVFTPGVLLFVLSDAVMALAAILSLAAVRRMWWVPVLSLVIVIVGTAGIFTDFAGLLGPKPSLLPREEHLISSDSGVHDVVFRVTNQGRRPIWVSTGEKAGPVPVRFSVSRQTPDGSWRAVGRPAALKRASAESWLPVVRSNVPADRLAQGAVQEYQFELPPGTYRAVLESDIAGYERLEQNFSLSGPGNGATPPTPVPAASRQRTPLPQTETPERPATARIDQIRVRLRGVVDSSEGRQNPLFTMALELPDGRTLQKRLRLGANLFGPWTLAEFDPGRNAVTATNGERRMVLETGEWVNLPVPREALE